MTNGIAILSGATTHSYSAGSSNLLSHPPFLIGCCHNTWPKGLSNTRITSSSQPIYRIRSDNFPVYDDLTELICGVNMMIYSAIFVCGVRLPFPSHVEHIMWITASTIMLAYAIFGGIFFFWLDYNFFRPPQNRRLSDDELTKSGLFNITRRLLRIYIRLTCGDFSKRDTSNAKVWIDHNQVIHIPYGILMPVQLLNALYAIVRVFVLVEDIIGLRSLPLSTFTTVNWSLYLPNFS